MLRTRLITAAIGIPILLWLVFAAPFPLYRAVVLVLTLIGVVEYFQMAFAGESRMQVLGIVAGGLAALGMASASPGIEFVSQAALALSAVVMATVMAGLIGALFSPDTPERSVNRLGCVLLGILYAGAFLPHFVWLRAVTEDGPSWVFYVIALSFAGDTGGYFAGRAWGRTPLMPTVSPKKTVEGSLGSFTGNLVAGLVVKTLLIPTFGWVEMVLVSLVAGGLSQIGDLCESLLKRGFGAKDSGWLIPGHGGLLDRTDSLVFPLVFVYYYVSWFRGPL